MFAALQTEVEARFASLEAHLRATKYLKGDSAAAVKGLLFIQTYAIYEYTVRNVLRTSIDMMNGRKYKMKELSPRMLALFLDAELTAFKDCGKKNLWKARLRIFDRAFSSDPVILPTDTRIPDDGSHFRFSHLQLILEVFDIKRLPVRRTSHGQRINEVVDHRNAIAHGRDTAENVGRRYSRAEVSHILKQMKSVCKLLISIFDQFCSNTSSHRRRLGG